MSAAAPTPAADEIRRTLSTLFAPGDVIELRAIHKSRKRVDAGYFDAEHRNELIETSARLNGAGVAVYVTLNPLDPQLLARCANRVQDFAQATATDTNVTRRCWLLIDIDPQRPKDTSSTDSQYELARQRGRAIYAYLSERDWPKPAVAHSGNGVHLLYRVDLPNNDESRDLIKNALEALAARFDDHAVKVDRTVFNAARIIKLHGTVATKGDHVSTAPWRLSKLLSVPESIQPVSVELLSALAAEIATNQPKPNGSTYTGNARAWTESDMAAFLARGGIEAVGPEPHDGAQRWKLKSCPFNPDHGPGESAVFLRPDGRLGFDCKHNGCADKHWRDLRELVDGPREARRQNGTGNHPFVSSVSEPPGHSQSFRPLPDPLPRVPAFDLGLLPDSIRPWVEDHADAMQCPPEFVAIGAMVALAGTIGRQVAIAVKQRERWIERPILWGCIVGRPSSGKTPALTPIRAILSRLEAAGWDQYQHDVREYEARQLVSVAAKQNAQKLARKKLEQGDTAGAMEAAEAAITDEGEPQQARLVVNDVTVEKMGEILNANPRGLVLFRDELSGWLASLDREGREGDRAFWLECWTGTGPYTCDRIGRGTVRIEACAVSILGGTQPGKIAEYVRAACKGGSGDDGLLPRFQLAIYPEQPTKWRYVDRPPNQSALDACWQTFQRLEHLPIAQIGAERHEFIDVPFLRFSPEAQELFIEWYSALMTSLRSGSEAPIMESHRAKYPALAARLALIIHLSDGGTGSVSAAALGKALDWTEYLTAHARRIYAPVADGGLSAAHALLAKRAELLGAFTSRAVQRKCWAGLDREAIESGLECLTEYGYLDSMTEDTGGRPTTRYQWRSAP